MAISKYVVIFCLFLVGCANEPMWWGPPLTPEETAAIEKEQAEAKVREEQERTRAIIVRYTPFCNELGFKSETPAFSDCILRLHQQDEYIAAQRRIEHRLRQLQ